MSPPFDANIMMCFTVSINHDYKELLLYHLDVFTNIKHIDWKSFITYCIYLTIITV